MGTPIFTEGFIEAFNEDPSQFVGRTISEREAYEMYDEMLDDGGDTLICGHFYQTSYCLKEIDEIAYRCGFSDYTASLEEDNIFVEGITYPPNS